MYFLYLFLELWRQKKILLVLPCNIRVACLFACINRTIAESKKKHEEKQMKAQQLREKLREEKTLKLQKLLERVSF